MKEFHGLIVPIFTPVDEKGNLDTEAFKNLASDLVRRGVDGLYVTGTTGEASQLSTETWKKVNQTAIEMFRGTPTHVYCGAVAPGTLETIERIHILEDMGAEYVFATPTFYNTDGTQAQVLKHFERICAHTDRKVIVYSISFTTHVDITTDTLSRLAEMDNIIGVKDTRADWGTHIQNIMALKDTRVGIAVVPEPMIAASLIMGADGIVTALGNLMPEYYVQILKAARAGNFDGVMKAFEDIMRFDRSLRCPGENGVAKLKYVASQLGVCPPYTSMSCMDVTAEQKAALQGAVRFIWAEKERLDVRA